jgi:ERCC4-type nuclease
MSNREDLVPYLIDKKKKSQRPTIIVDSREASTANKIVDGLKKRKVNIKINALDKGDYILSSNCAIERKTVQDFIFTLTRRHLFEQIFKLKEAYPDVLLLLEGHLPVIYKYSRIKPASIWGAMFYLAKKGIAIVNTTSFNETIVFLITAAYQEQFIKKRAPTVHPIKKCQTIYDAQIFLLASLPNIGREREL